jgi:hypothetical protein
LEIFGIAVLRLFDDLADPGVSEALFLKRWIKDIYRKNEEHINI